MSNRSKLCVIIVLVFFCSSAWAGIGYVQGAHSAASYSSGSASLTSTQAGDTILVAVFVNIGGTISPPTDTQNNTWTADTNYFSPNSFNTGMQIWRASNIAGGNDTITVSQNNSGTVGNALVSVNAYEYSGLATSSPVDGVYAESSGCGTASGAAGSIATSNANDLIFVFFADPGGSALSAGSGFTQRDTFTTSGDPMLAEDDIVSSTGIYAGTATVGGSLGCNQGMMVAYKAAGAVSAGMAYVQGAHSSASYGSGAVSFMTTQAGDTILAAVFVNIGGTINPPTDTQHNTWTADTNYFSPNSFNTGMQIWRASNIAGGSDTITISQNNSGTVGSALVSVNAYEYSGVAISSPVDGVYAESSACGTASGTTGPVMTTNANDLLFAFFADPGGSPLSPGSGFTPRDSFTTGGNPMLVEHAIVSSTGTYTGTATVGGSLGCNEGMMVAYKAAAGAISGTISGAGGNGATVTLSGAASATVTANSSGAYAFTGLASGSYTVTPSLAGFTFSPASQPVTVSNANVTGVNFSTVTYTISGTISGTGGNGATVTLTQGSTTIATVTADSSGNYTFNAVANGTYTVTPTKSGYSCTPASQSVTVNGAPVTGVNFTASALSIYTISGSLIPSANGSAATVTLSGAASATTTADASGNFSFSGLASGAYTVAASKAGFAISPASQAVTVSGVSVTGVNFTAAIALAIDAVAPGDGSVAGTSVASGAFSTTSANELLLAFIASDAKTAGITVTGVSGGGLTWALVRRTNAQMGTAEVWRAFAPAQLSSVAVTATLSQSVVASITVVSFTGADATGTAGSGALGATAGTSAASGAPTASLVTTRNNSWVFGVGDDWDKATARTLGASQTMVHQLLAKSADTYWVQRQSSTTPLSGTSVTINDTAPTTDRYNLTIVEVLPPAAGTVATYGIYGTLSPSAQGSGVTVTLSGAASATTTADSSGNYGFSGLANGSYTVTPAKSGSTITPSSQTVTVDGFSLKGVNFSVMVPTWSLSGNLSPAASGSGATVTLGGAGSSTTTADSSGNYSFSGLVNGTYSVTPSKSGYAFNPVAQSATINSANVSNVNFTVSVAPIAVSISPAAVSLLTGGVQQFTATVTGTTNTAVTWTATGGTVSSSGRYTAPSTTGSYTVKATSVADTTKSATAAVTVTTASSSTVLLGDANVEAQVGSIPAGQAEAFQATAIASGAVQSLVVYLDSTSTASQLVVGLYADASGHPGALLSQGSSTTPVAGAWNPILVPAATLAAGTPYWIAILGTTSGTLAFREATPGSCASEIDAQSSLTSLPASWTTGTVGSNCPASVFGDSTKVLFFDNFPGTTLSSYWTIISRHGEYTQSETECNVPQMVSVNNGLTITTEAQSASCGDYFTAPSSWPYITGDIQWANLNFTYGTIEIEAKFPSVNTSLWPATWLLGSNCQYTNPLTGNTGVTINGHNCPNLGSSGYTEIDMTECYGGSSGWCQFHVANPNFGPCDGNYSVDTNFHTFTTIWNSSGITQYMDGTSRATCNQQLGNPMFLIIQTQTGGVGGTPNNSLLPAELVVEYVKVTQP